MNPYSRYTTVTRDGWSVGATTGTDIDGAILHVHRGSYRDASGRMRLRKGDADGMRFASSDEAHRYAYEHGYSQQHVAAWCSSCRALHRSTIGANPRRTGFCPVHHTFTSKD